MTVPKIEVAGEEIPFRFAIISGAGYTLAVFRDFVNAQSYIRMVPESGIFDIKTNRDVTKRKLWDLE